MSWYPGISTGKLLSYRQVPKVDLHRHLEGSLRLETLLEIAGQHGIPLPKTDFHALVQMQREDTLNFSTFLSKFQTLRLFYRSPEVIARITEEAIADAARDGVVYLELRFTPVALGRLQGFSLARVMDWVARAAAEASQKHHIRTGLIASINRHEPVELAEEVARLSAERIDQGVVGIDLAGNEAEFPALPFVGVFREARENGLHITIHGGEWGGPENVRIAIEDFGAERIGHGVRVLEDPAVVELARERGVAFEVCVTSNYQSGVVPTLAAHPLARLIESDLKVTLNTDDPSISGITLSDEYRLVLEEFGLTPVVLSECILNAAHASFLPQTEALALENWLRESLPGSFGRL
jgi:adenosine deaminase